jgi:phosphopantetheinyl transferase
MPLVFQQNINEHTQLGLWKIEEELDFFSTAKTNTKEISHPQKRKQHLAGRFLLKMLLPELDVESIIYSASGKPFVMHQTYFFSVSHTDGWVAAIVSKQKNVAVDIEIISDKAYQIRNRFLLPRELTLMMPELIEVSNLSTMLWSVKESLYKYYGQGEVDFKRDLLINQIEKLQANTFSILCQINKQTEMHVDVIGMLEHEFVLTYIV